MATIATPIPGDQWVVFDDVPWDTYLSLLKSRGERHVRLTYYRGVLEIMTLSKLHEILSEALDNFVNVLVKEFGFEVQSVGSMTMHVEELKSGAEADKAYYIQHEEIVRDREKYDPAARSGRGGRSVVAFHSANVGFCRPRHSRGLAIRRPAPVFQVARPRWHVPRD